tara:strand:- start:621 stop:887 length:267 start_codon:yes stop_codon:yes gene_type:complete
MAKPKGSGIYRDDDHQVMVNIPINIYTYLKIDAKKNFRSVPMHISYILTKRMNETTPSKVKAQDNRNLYTEAELKEIYRKSEGDNNGV